MEDFQEKYIQDAKELIENLEGSLLKLEEQSYDAEIIEEIFRFMHTLKGSAGMFGFHRIEELTHYLESVYDSVREGEREIDDELTQLTLDAVDLIKATLNNQGALSQEKQQEFDNLLKKSRELDQSTRVAGAEDQEEEVPEHEKEEVAQQYLYIISFTPQSYIYERGIRPSNIFKELSEITEFFSFPFTSKIPEFSSLKPEQFFISWEIVAFTEASREDIEDIFLFFEDNEYAVKNYPSNKITEELLMQESLAFAEKRLTMKDLPLQAEGTQKAEKKPAAQQPQTTNKSQEKKEETVRVSAEKLDELVNLVSDFVTLNSRLSLISERLEEDDLNKSLSELFKLSKRFRENALDLRLMPIEVLVVKFRRLVRDLSKKMNKEVEFTAEGTDTKLDKSIIEKIENPLMHIIRNAIDHGVESPEARKKLDKPQKGIVRMVAFYSGASVFVQIRDDGKGINKEYLRSRAVEKGIINESDRLSDEKIYNLIFRPGFSTAQDLTQVSGRGVGMDVVQQSITDLRGEINIESEINLGTSVTLKLPLTLSIIDALLVTVSAWRLLVPITSVETVKALTKKELARNERMQVEYDGKLIPLIDLRTFMEIPGEAPDKQKVIVLIHEGKHYGMLVDKIKSEHQAVIKPLGFLHRKQEYLAGASVLGDGNLALILNVKSLIKHKSESIHVS